MDPFAAKLADGSKGRELSEAFASGLAGAAFNLWPEFHRTWTVVRTKFIDDTMEEIVASTSADDSVVQFVNLGAGLDTRCYRLECLSQVARAYEIDMDVINTPKRALFQALGITKPLCLEYNIVSADLKQPRDLQSKLETLGFDKSQKTIYLAEGLIMYLGDQQQTFVQQISKLAAPGSTWILNFLDHPNAPPGSSFPTEDMKSELTKEGWVDLKVNKFGDDVLNYGRFPNDEYQPSPAFSFVVATKSEGKL